jgi:mono/diheme cytochrome c family protein
MWLAVAPALLLTLIEGSSPVAARSTRSGYDEAVQPFLADHCYGCHNAAKNKGGLNLKQFAGGDPVATDPDAWEKIVAKIRSGEMPPEDEERPSKDDIASVTAWIDEHLASADRAAPPDPGRITVRRLNRAEYNNTIRDLLALDLQPADEFPQDDSGYGFDNIGDVLSVPPLLAERYMVAAERVARTAVFGTGAIAPTLLECRAKSRFIDPTSLVPGAYDETGLAMPNAVHAVKRLPATGTYRVRVYAGGSRPAGSDPIRIALWIDGTRVGEESLDPTPQAGFFHDKQDFSGKVRELTLRITGGEHWIAASIPALYEGLPALCHGPHPSSRPNPPRPEFTPPPDASPDKIERMRKQFDEDNPWPPLVNDARISYFEILGPYDAEPGPSIETKRRLYACGHLDGRHGPACPRVILRSLARRAYRRPIAAADLDPLVALFTTSRAQGDSFEEALSASLHAILVSPDFLFRLEGVAPRLVASHASPAAGPGWPDRLRVSAGASAGAVAKADGLPHTNPDPVLLTDHELATRLSYFLWASMPDRRLRRLADEGRLRAPGVLETEVRRMLRDPKAHALVSEFGGQWLQVRALESVAPDKERFPAFDDYLRLSMRRETELFFERVIREDRSILEFLDAPWTFLNERLALHYGVRDVRGPEFRPVVFDGVPRAGVLTQASVLTVSSYATRTSPVLRGKWILENLLNAPPPAPPPGVPPLEEPTTAAQATSVRERLEAHRANPTCASCHRRMDPLGFGLEHYDAIGAWRDKDGDSPIDASGALPDGRTFDDAVGLQAILATEREAFTKAIGAKLLTWALGRGLDAPDRRLLRQIARDLPGDQYRFSALVLAIVRSPAFQMRRGLPS